MTRQSRHVIDRRRHQNVQAGFLIPARTRRGLSPDPLPSKAPVRHRLARPLEIERTWGDAPETPTDTLDRFESAIAFAIREATRLQCDSESRAMAVSRIEVPER
jgi:hypothetical protein